MPGVPQALQALATLVVKEGVALGGLGEDTRQLALGLVWAGLPQPTMTEAAVNEALRQQLAGPARCLGTDHVELRRWLCDAGWLQRDGWGRAYQRVARAALPPPRQALAAALEQLFEGTTSADWVAQRRAARAAERLARRRAHEGAGLAAAAR